MKKTLLFQFFSLGIAALIVTSCSGDKKEKNEMNILEKKQHEIAQEAVQRIKTPLEKAEKAKELLDKQSMDLEKELDKD
jgi:ABC-type uncharacterized transport system substrate-binding protein